MHQRVCVCGLCFSGDLSLCVSGVRPLVVSSRAHISSPQTRAAVCKCSANFKRWQRKRLKRSQSFYLKVSLVICLRTEEHFVTSRTLLTEGGHTGSSVSDASGDREFLCTCFYSFIGFAEKTLLLEGILKEHLQQRGFNGDNWSPSTNIHDHHVYSTDHRPGRKRFRWTREPRQHSVWPQGEESGPNTSSNIFRC